MASESPQVRRRPTKPKLGDPQRDSNVVRASVLETALELGFAQNSTVADWIFNNPLSEESEDFHSDDQGRLEQKSDPPPDLAEAVTPTFTSGSNSTSDESSLNSPGNNAPSAAITTIQVHMHKPSVTESPHVHFGDLPADQLQLFSPFALSLRDAHDEETRGSPFEKLLNDNGRSRSQDDGLNGNPCHECPSPGPPDSGYTSEGQYLSKGKMKKGKDKPGKVKGNKDSDSKALEISDKDVDYATDGGYLSASSNKSQGKSSSKVKSRAMAFFRRRPKKSGRGSDDEDEDSIPPVPAIPVLPRPSSPRLLERRAATPPTRSGFSPLTLNLSNPPASPPRQMSKSPPPVRARATSPQRSDHLHTSQRPASLSVASAPSPTVLTPATTAATIPLPPSMPSTPLSTSSFPPISSPLAGLGSTLKSQSSKQHLTIPPPAPPPTLPLPQPPPSPSTSPNALSTPIPATPTTPSRRCAPARPIPVLPTVPGSTQPLTPRRVASPFRPLLSSRVLHPAVSQGRNTDFPYGPEGDQAIGKEFTARQRSGTAVSAGLGSTPAFLQRRIQHGPPPSPRHPPPDAPLPPSPGLVPNTRPRTPIGSPSKFHEHFSSVSSVPMSHILSPMSMSPSQSTATLSESSSEPSIRSSHVSSVSERSRERAVRDSLNIPECSRQTTSTSNISELSYGRPVTSTFNRSAMDLKSRFSDRSDVSSSIYSRAIRRDCSSVTTFEGDDADIDEAASKSYADEEDDDASMYPSDDKTAGRRTMYLVEHGELEENGDEIVVAEGHYLDGHDAPPPLPPLPLLPARPGPGYF